MQLISLETGLFKVTINETKNLSYVLAFARQ